MAEEHPELESMEAWKRYVAECQAKSICARCKKPARWYSDAGRREYQISGLCEYCFDAMFAVE
jgi:hypothetical protein